MLGNISHTCSMPNDICDSLLEWLSTFDAVNNVSYKPKELTDGLVLSSVLKEVSQNFLLSILFIKTLTFFLVPNNLKYFQNPSFHFIFR